MLSLRKNHQLWLTLVMALSGLSSQGCSSTKKSDDRTGASASQRAVKIAFATKDLSLTDGVPLVETYQLLVHCANESGGTDRIYNYDAGNQPGHTAATTPMTLDTSLSQCSSTLMALTMQDALVPGYFYVMSNSLFNQSENDADDLALASGTAEAFSTPANSIGATANLALSPETLLSENINSPSFDSQPQLPSYGGSNALLNIFYFYTMNVNRPGAVAPIAAGGEGLAVSFSGVPLPDLSVSGLTLSAATDGSLLASYDAVSTGAGVSNSDSACPAGYSPVQAWRFTDASGSNVNAQQVFSQSDNGSVASWYPLPENFPEALASSAYPLQQAVSQCGIGSSAAIAVFTGCSDNMANPVAGNISYQMQIVILDLVGNADVNAAAPSFYSLCQQLSLSVPSSGSGPSTPSGQTTNYSTQLTITNSSNSAGVSGTCPASDSQINLSDVYGNFLESASCSSGTFNLVANYGYTPAGQTFVISDLGNSNPISFVVAP